MQNPVTSPLKILCAHNSQTNGCPGYGCWNHFVRKEKQKQKYVFSHAISLIGQLVLEMAGLSLTLNWWVLKNKIQLEKLGWTLSMGLESIFPPSNHETWWQWTSNVHPCWKPESYVTLQDLEVLLVGTNMFSLWKPILPPVFRFEELEGISA